MSRHTLPNLDLLHYALDGAHTQLVINYERLDEDEREILNRDIAEIKRRIKLVEIAEARKEKSHD